MTGSNQKTLMLGTEYDDALRDAIRGVMRRLGAKKLSHNWVVVGSQEIETLEVLVGTDRVVVEAETYIGLSVCGPIEVVDRLQSMIKAEIERA